MGPNDAPRNHYQHALQIETHTKCVYKVVNIWNWAVALKYLTLARSFALLLWITKFCIGNLKKNIKCSWKKLDGR